MLVVEKVLRRRTGVLPKRLNRKRSATNPRSQRAGTRTSVQYFGQFSRQTRCDRGPVALRRLGNTPRPRRLPPRPDFKPTNLQPSCCNLIFCLENVEVVRTVGDSPEGRSPQ